MFILFVPWFDKMQAVSVPHLIDPHPQQQRWIWLRHKVFLQNLTHFTLLKVNFCALFHVTYSFILFEKLVHAILQTFFENLMLNVQSPFGVFLQW